MLTRSLLFFSSAMLFCASTLAQSPAPLALAHPVQDKNFYLLSAIQNDPAAHAAIRNDEALNTIRADREAVLKTAIHRCKQDTACELKSLLWTEEEIDAASRALAHLYTTNAAVHTLADGQLKNSGAYILSDDDAARLRDAWAICAHGLNDILNVYGLGVDPRYPAIDSFSVDPKSTDFQQQIAQFAATESKSTDVDFFSPSLDFALELLVINHRDEAGRHEPLEADGNKAAFAAVATTKWDKFPYSVILVPGAGPEDPTVALSPEGRARIEQAAAAYNAGKAPFILVSGGYVHPKQTHFAEAIEMKRALIAAHIPESAILIDPHARHTTTNIRNAVREIFRDRIPMTKQVLIVSDTSQIGAIASQSFADRCLRELGYLPYTIVSQPDAKSVAILPRIESLEQDPIDPLDP